MSKKTHRGGATSNESSTIATGGELHQSAGGTHPNLTTNQGLGVADNQNSLKAQPRGPTLLEDFILREKITHFDHERIPERVVHARGTGVHGFFELTASLAKYTRAGRRCSKTSSCARRSTTSTTSASRSASCTRAAPACTATSS